MLAGHERPGVRTVGATQVDLALTAEQVDEHPGLAQRVGLTVGGEVDDPALGVGRRTAEPFSVDVLAGHLAHDVRTGDQHPTVRRHHDEVGERGTVRGAAGCRADHDRQLQHPAAGADLRGENSGDRIEAGDALAQPRPTGVPDTDDRQLLGDGLVGDRGDGPAADRAQGPTLHGRIGRERQHLAAADLAAGDHDAIDLLEDHRVVEQVLEPGFGLRRDGREDAGHRVSTKDTS